MRAGRRNGEWWKNGRSGANRKSTKKMVHCTSEMRGSGTAKNAVNTRVYIYSVPVVPVNIYIGI